MNFATVHGFNVKDNGARTVDQLVPFILEAGYLVDKDEADYGYFNIWMIRLFRTKTRARVLHRLAKAFEHSDVIITHSNGGYFATLALEMMGEEYNNTKLVIHISPAMDKNTDIPLAVKHQLVLHTKNDFWVKLSSWIPFFPWGRMGARGYSGEDNRNTNLADDSIPGHSAWFKSSYAYRTWTYCNDFIKEQTK